MRANNACTRRVWRRFHIGINGNPLEIRTAGVTTSDIGDAPVLPERLDTIPPQEAVARVTGDGGFDTLKCHRTIDRNEILHTSRRGGRTIWRRSSGYYCRSRALSRMPGVKRPGQRPPAGDFDRQVAGVRARVAVLSGFPAPGLPVTQVADCVCRGKGDGRLSTHSCDSAMPSDAKARQIWENFAAGTG